MIYLIIEKTRRWPMVKGGMKQLKAFAAHVENEKKLESIGFELFPLDCPSCPSFKDE